jgi:hypothetical protein
VVVSLSGAKSPWMSLTLDAIKNNRLSPSLRRRAREGDFRDLCILTSHGGRRQPWKSYMRGAADWMYISPRSLPVFLSDRPALPNQTHVARMRHDYSIPSETGLLIPSGFANRWEPADTQLKFQPTSISRRWFPRNKSELPIS